MHLICWLLFTPSVAPSTFQLSSHFMPTIPCTVYAGQQPLRSLFCISFFLPATHVPLCNSHSQSVWETEIMALPLGKEKDKDCFSWLLVASSNEVPPQNLKHQEVAHGKISIRSSNIGIRSDGGNCSLVVISWDSCFYPAPTSLFHDFKCVLKELTPNPSPHVRLTYSNQRAPYLCEEKGHID